VKIQVLKEERGVDREGVYGKKKMGRENSVDLKYCVISI
jgi:hypothetical protein